MVKLFALRLSIAVWKRSLSISKKLKARTWVALAVLHACLAIVSFWAYQAKSVPDSAIPPIYDAEVRPIPLPIKSGESLQTTFTINNRGNCAAYLWQINVSQASNGSAGHVAIVSTVGFNWSTSSNVQSYNVSIAGMGFVSGGSHVHFYFRANPFGPPVFNLPDYGRTVVVQAPSSEAPYLFEPVYRTGALIIVLFMVLLKLVDLFFAWQASKRSRAEEALINLQTEKIRLEIALLRQQWEKAEREAQKSGIILLS